MSGKWSHETIVKFLEEYKKHKCLWDSSLPSYKNRDYRHKAVEDMVQALALPDLNIHSLREKVRIIRNTYIKEVNKINKSKIYATSPKDFYTPKLTWFSVADEFLKSCVQLKSADRKSGVDEKDEEETADPDETSQGNGELSSVRDLRFPPGYVRPEVKEAVKGPRLDDVGDVLGRNKRKRRRGSDSVCRVIKVLKTISRTSLLEEHEFDMYGKSIAAQLKQLPLPHALELQSKFQNLIVETRLSLLSSRTRGSDVLPSKEAPSSSSTWPQCSSPSHRSSDHP